MSRYLSNSIRSLLGFWSAHNLKSWFLEVEQGMEGWKNQTLLGFPLFENRVSKVFNRQIKAPRIPYNYYLNT